MNAIRAVMTAFLLAVLSLAILGWRWSADLPSPKLEGARVALALVGLTSLGGMGILWSVKPRKAP